MQTNLYKEARRLYALGFAVHWLHPKSKRPIESGWTTGPRKDWTYLEQTYIDSLNVGVRLGNASRVGNGFLAVVDVDVKSNQKHHRVEAVRAAKKLLGDRECPTVASGRGNGSRHYYCLTALPFKTWNPAYSDEEVKVHMPSKSPSKRELATLTPDEINSGLRLSRAWEVSLYSEGRQVVLPPSIHPDSGMPYQWVRQGDFPLVEFPKEPVKSETKKRAAKTFELDDAFTFVVVPVDLGWLGISDKVKKAIIDGEGVSDRSGYLLPAATALYSAGLSRDEILTVLTDKDTFLGACAFDHAKTQDRARAAYWLYKYTVKRIILERSGAGIFSPASEYEAPVKLTPEETAKQSVALRKTRQWFQDIRRSGKEGDGAPLPTIENIQLILSNVVGKTVVQRNEFAFRDAYGIKTPWGGGAGNAITDDDIPRIMVWLGKNWGFEPGKDAVFNALTVMACENAFDPVRDSLDALSAWDKVPRLNHWLKNHFEAEGPAEYCAQVFRKWICAMVLRVYFPGTKFDWMPIFEGLQGVGKSSFGRILGGDKYFLDWLPNLADKDSALALQGIWVVEMGELSQFRKNELEVIKGFITRTVDKVRPPFGRRWLEAERRCVFFGTTNRETYLRDDTGNRRFKPLKVGALNFDQLREDRDQLFAEAKWLVENFHETEKTLELVGEAREYEKRIHAEKMVEDDASAMSDLIQDFVEKEARKPKIERFTFTKFKLQSLFSDLGPLRKWPFNSRNMMFAAKALKLLGGEKWKSDGTMYWKLSDRDTSEAEGSLEDFY